MFGQSQPWWWRTLVHLTLSAPLSHYCISHSLSYWQYSTPAHQHLVQHIIYSGTIKRPRTIPAIIPNHHTSAPHQLRISNKPWPALTYSCKIFIQCMLWGSNPRVRTQVILIQPPWTSRASMLNIAQFNLVIWTLLYFLFHLKNQTLKWNSTNLATTIRIYK